MPIVGIRFLAQRKRTYGPGIDLEKFSSPFTLDNQIWSYKSAPELFRSNKFQPLKFPQRAILDRFALVTSTPKTDAFWVSELTPVCPKTSPTVIGIFWHPCTIYQSQNSTEISPKQQFYSPHCTAEFSTVYFVICGSFREFLDLISYNQINPKIILSKSSSSLKFSIKIQIQSSLYFSRTCACTMRDPFRIDALNNSRI